MVRANFIPYWVRNLYALLDPISSSVVMIRTFISKLYIFHYEMKITCLDVVCMGLSYLVTQLLFRPRMRSLILG